MKHGQNYNVLTITEFPLFFSLLLFSASLTITNRSFACRKRKQTRNPSIYNIICWFAGPMGQTTRRPRFWCSKYYFFHEILQNSLQKPFQFICFVLYKITKMKIKSFGCPKSIRKYEKRILKKSDAWSTSCLSHQPSKPAYYIVDWQIFCGFQYIEHSSWKYKYTLLLLI